MRGIYSLLALSLLSELGTVSSAYATEPSIAPEIWVTSTSQLSKALPNWVGIRTDASIQWTPNAAWPNVAAHARVAKLSAGNIENTSEANLKAVIDEVRRRHMALALEIGPLVRTLACGPPTESYGHQGETEAILQRIHDAGGQLDYVAMDEPFYYGHVDPGGCRLPSIEIAHQVATSVASMRRIFPNLKAGDIEVVEADPSRQPGLLQWIDDYRTAMGEPLAFLHADVAWSESAMHTLPSLAAGMHQRHVPFGIIYNAGGNMESDLEWTRSALDHAAEIETALGVHPDAAIFQTWVRNPTHVLPETQPGTLMNVALRYLQPASNLSLSRYGDGISGTLSGSKGAPIAGAVIQLSAVDTAGRSWPTLRSLSATVPEGAATAVVGYRVGTEGACDCGGASVVILGGLHYREQGKPVQDISPVTLPVANAPVSLRTVVITPGKTSAPNLKQFPVTSGASFSFGAWIAAPQAAERSGYATVVFLDANGKGLLRRILWFDSSAASLGTAVTDSEGHFHMAWPSKAPLPRESEIRALSDSIPSFEPSMAVLPAIGGEAAKQIRAVRLTGAAIIAMPDPVLAAMASDLKARHIALGLEILATNWWHESACGGGLEGYVDPGTTNNIVAKLIRSGATLDFVAMDEPLWFGHFYSGKNACRSTINDLARRVAVNIRIYTAAFPNVVVGDIEPFPAVSGQPNWQATYSQWTKTFATASRSRLGFLDLDFDWYAPPLKTSSGPGKADPAAIAALARTIAAVARENGLQIGMIMNGGGPPPASSDADWISQARQHIQTLDTSGVRFDPVLLETWDKYPAHTFSESGSANTLSGLVAAYTQAHH